ncbi:MAG: response regulator transcription factor [Steroidobacteraceae bacterium]|nr:response regulator transcription factor [Deltaproteobacteria bacterium]
MIRVLIADDHPIYRKGLLQILMETPDMFAVYEAGSGEEALAKVCDNDYDLVLLDLSMPGRGGLDALKVLKSHYPKLPVLVLSMHPEEQYAVRALRAGASGYLNKECAWHELVNAIHKVLEGGKYVSAALAENLASNLGNNANKPLQEVLSDREYQVFRMIASGKTVGAIATELSLSVKTISTHRVRILEKMRLKNNTELIHYFASNRLCD